MFADMTTLAIGADTSHEATIWAYYIEKIAPDWRDPDRRLPADP